MQEEVVNVSRDMKILRKESKENTGYSKHSNRYEECLWQAFDTPEKRISELKCKLIDTFQLKCKMKKEWTTTEKKTEHSENVWH